MMTTEAIMIACDGCRAEFDLGPRVRTKREGKVETGFFACPHCGHEYIICRTDPEIRKLRQQVRAYRTRIETRRAKGTLETKHFEHFEQLTNKLQAKMDEFNSRTA